MFKIQKKLFTIALTKHLKNWQYHVLLTLKLCGQTMQIKFSTFKQDNMVKKIVIETVFYVLGITYCYKKIDTWWLKDELI